MNSLHPVMNNASRFDRSFCLYPCHIIITDHHLCIIPSAGLFQEEIKGSLFRHSITSCIAKIPSFIPMPVFFEERIIFHDGSER
mmetsp:Transcript_17143/g.24895  ORF Transcript_17143/g.24895 Transcript_17143/m.24895 type:complete len:84 (-) Transcript_17143:441-692(-)